MDKSINKAPSTYAPPKLIAKRYEILRGVKVGGTAKDAMPLPEQPVRVATLIDEQAFLEGGELVHNKTVFLEDRHHDWDWRAGQFWYYTRVALEADVVVVYELEKR
jgi:hypothetical protein